MQERKKAIERFLEYYLHEEYGDAKEWAKTQKADIAFFKHVELFFTALETVESSYRYDDATKIFRGIIDELEKRECIFNAPLFAALCKVEIDRLAIDKAIYTQNEVRLHRGVDSMLGHTKEALVSLIDADLEKEQARTLKERLEAYEFFANGMYIVAKLYAHRWTRKENLPYESLKADVLGFVQKLREKEHYILAYDLKAHLFTLDRFYEEQRPQELFIQNGTVSFSYYAVVDTKTQEWLEERLGSEDKEALSLFGISPIELVMEDIWSDLKFKYFITHHIWELGGCTLEGFFQEGLDVVFEVTLHYYTMGVFIVDISLPLEHVDERGVSVTAYRALLGLGANFALSERYVFANRQFSFMQEIARYVFDTLETHLKKRNPTCHNPLFYDEVDFSPFVISNLYEFATKKEEGYEALYGMKRLKELQSYRGIVSEVKEVRTSIDNWMMYETKSFENLSPIRYYEEEVIKIDLDQALLVLPEEAEWVRTQAMDSVFMAMAVFNLLDLNANKYILRLESMLDYKAAKKRFDDEKSCEDEFEYIDKQKAWLERLVEIMDNGLMTQFPDHTRFMEAIYKRLNLQKSKEKTLGALEVFKKHQEKNTRKWFRFLFLSATALVSTSALSDIFGIVNKLGYGDIVTPAYQLGIIVFCVVALVYLSFKSEDGKDG